MNERRKRLFMTLTEKTLKSRGKTGENVIGEKTKIFNYTLT